MAQLARRTGRTEIDIAEDVLARAQNGEGARRHVGWFLLREVLGAPEKRRDGAWYIAAVIVGTLALSLLLGFATGSVSGAVLLLIPVSEAVKGLLDAVLLRVTKPRFVPRLALRRGIPPEGKTLCVIAALLTCPGDAHTLAARLEEYALCNRDAGEQLLFGLLADLPEADMEHAPIDPAILRAAREEIEALNARYGGRFYLFTRERVQTPDGKWSAWERKRGALLRLAQLLCGEADAMHCAAGDAAALRGTAYLLTLDADTRLTPGAARALAGAMLHPLNRPVVDAQRGVVTHGYGLLHPRMATELQSARASDWARVFAGPGGSDPYGGVCGELYMDCFDRGGFSGKGILDVRALLACCGGDALPEQRILSHDALEGAYLHGGFLGDVELTDTFPAAPLAWGARAHRWIRGDWQNAPWIFSRRARALHPIDRFRLADSLRRSLVAPATWAAVFLGCVLRWPGLRLAAYAALLALAQGLIFALGHPIVHPADARVRYHSSVLPGLAAAVVQTVLRLILLPWEAVLNASAIVTALWRMTVSHRDLLQWQTAAQRAAKRDGLGAYLRALWPASALGLLTAVLTPSPTGWPPASCGRSPRSCSRRSARRMQTHRHSFHARRSGSCWAGQRRRGSILRRSAPPGSTTCRRTTCRPSRRPARRTAHRRRTWALRSCPRSAHTHWALTTGAAWLWRSGCSRPWSSSHAGTDTFTTGITRARCGRCRRCMCPRWTAATAPPPCSRRQTPCAAGDRARLRRGHRRSVTAWTLPCSTTRSAA